MAQSFNLETAKVEAAQLLKLALAILDQGDSEIAANYVAQALELLMAEENPTSSDGSLSLDTNLPPAPTWGNLVDRPQITE